MPAAVAIPAAIAGGGALLNYFGQQQAISAQKDANAQSLAAQQKAEQDRIDLAKQQYEQQRTDLSQYRNQGGQGLDLMSTLLGAKGPDAQAQALQTFQNDPTLQMLISQGQRGVLKSESATGQLRSGSAQSAVAGVAPSILQKAINDRIAQLNGLAGIGENAANMTGYAGGQMVNQSNAATADYGTQASQLAQSNGQLGSVNPLLNSMGYGLGYLQSPSGQGLLSGISSMFSGSPEAPMNPGVQGIPGYTDMNFRL